jgi:hypothetical protein
MTDVSLDCIMVSGMLGNIITSKENLLMISKFIDGIGPQFEFGFFCSYTKEPNLILFSLGSKKLFTEEYYSPFNENSNNSIIALYKSIGSLNLEN